MSGIHHKTLQNSSNGARTIDRLLYGAEQAIRLTRFESRSATRKTDLTWTLHRLQDAIREARAPDKAGLPWFKLAVFGDERSPLRPHPKEPGRMTGGSYRTNANVLAVTGVEGDYDAGAMSLDEAADAIQRAGVTAILYTTARATPERPRWRVMAPFRRELPPGVRRRMLARLNGVLGGVLADESFTLSQAYYAGSVEGVAPVRVEIVEGDYLDDADGLDAGAIGDAGDEPLAAAPADKTDCDWPLFRDAALSIPNGPKLDSRDAWLKIGAAIHCEDDGGPDGLELFDEWSQAHDSYDHGETERVYDSFSAGRPGGATGWTIIREAERHGWRGRFKAMLARMPDRVDPVTARLNERYAAVRHAGRTLIAETKADGSFKLGSVDDLHRWHDNDPVTAPKGRAQEPASKHWMRDPDRRQFEDGIVFDPSGRAPRTALNLWMGFAVEPKPQASCVRIVEHIRDVICDGREKRFRYVIGYLAHMVQRPGEKPDVALVLKGGKGAGKDTLAVLTSKIIGGRHVAHVDNPERLTSRFNAIFATAILGHVEEAYWAGDRAKKGALQALITAPTMTLELKGVDAISVESFLRLIMTTNEAWAVPASADERRYAVFDVAGDRMGDHDYFRTLYAEIDGDGPAAFLAHLLGVDLSNFDIRDVPQTAALRDQKLASLSGVASWWRDVLESGELPGDRHGEWADAKMSVPRDALRESYAAFVRERRFGGDMVDAIRFGAELRQMAPSLGDGRPRVEGRPGPKHYVVPALSKARLEFEDWLKAPVDWEG